eukprot:TRINITY_DN4803_c0_g1_i1.p1 TRINITY_DN4803_c0_g1~~TRINITY_DN4803_c0_g1_i1.p1  ORF type:complete len:557 (-),score=107.09 TRINITY_DN4803_c0_g1_i1:34-1665(-)
MQAINDTIEGNDSLRKIKEWVITNPMRAAIVAVIAVAVIVAVIVIIVLAAGNKNMDDSSSAPGPNLNVTLPPSILVSPSGSNRTRFTVSPTYSPSMLNSTNKNNTWSNNSTMTNNSTMPTNSSSSNPWYYHDYSSPCNGRGLLYPDSNGICECFLDCWTGNSCQNYNSSSSVCSIYAKNDESLGVFEDYWVSRSNNFVPPFLAAEYRLPNQDNLRILSPSVSNGLSRRLYSAISYIHSVVGNANLTGRSIIIGYAGRNSLIQSALSFLYRRNNGTVSLYSKTPYNRDLPRICAWTQGLCTFTSNPSNVNPSNLFELVTIPNIPTGRTDSNITGLTFPNNPYYGVDANDNWPTWNYASYSNNNSLNLNSIITNAPVVFYSSSRFHGYESGRFAWALVSDTLLLNGMRDYISNLYVHGSVDSMYRELSILGYLNQTMEIFNMTGSVVMNRWMQVQGMFNSSSVVNGGWKVVSGAGSSSVMIECPMSGSDCQRAFEGQGLYGYPGSDFGYVASSTPGYYRLSIGVRGAVWPLLAARLGQVIGYQSS